MQSLRRIKFQLDDSGRSPVAVVEFRAVGARVVEHIDQKMVWLIPQYFYIDLLSGRVSMEKETGHQAGNISGLERRFKTPEQETGAGRDRGCAEVPNAKR